jgi:predicted nucleotidyltransferase
MFSSLTELVKRLQKSPYILGVLRYGGRKLGDESKGGDFDLYVITADRISNIESIHFYVNDIPVDMNIRTLADLGSKTPP